MDNLVIRPYDPDDDAMFTALPADGWLPEDDVWGRVAEIGGAVAGYSRIDHWDEADGTRLYLLTGYVDPALRRHGIGRALLAHQEAQAAAHWRNDPGAGPALLGGNADENQPETLALLLAAGYRVRFTVVDMARDTAGATDVDLPPGLTRRHDGEDPHCPGEPEPDRHPVRRGRLPDNRAPPAIRQAALTLRRRRDADAGWHPRGRR